MHSRILSALLIGLMTALATAAEERPREPSEQAKHIGEIVVTAKRGAGAAFDIPYITQSYDLSREVLESAPRSLPSQIESAPGVMGQKTAFGQESPYIRGFTGFRTLLLVDGIRVNHSAFREGPNQYWGLVDPQSLERLELVKGPASVLYGSDAIGGTANGFTRSPSFALPSGWDRRTYYRFASAEDSHIGRVELLAYQRERFGVIGGVSYKTFGDLRAGHGMGQLTGTGYDEIDGDLKLTLFPRKDARVTVAYQHVEQHDVPRWHSTVHSKSFAGTTLGTDLRRDADQTRDFAYARLELSELAAAIDRAEFTVSYQKHRETEDRIPANTRQQIQSFKVQTLGFTAQFASDTGQLGTWTYGLDFYRDWVDSSGSCQLVASGPLVEQPRGPVADDATYDLLGVFAQDELNFGDKWSVILGGRYTYARVDANKVLTTTPANFAPIQDDWHSVVGSGRLMFRVNPHWRLFAGISQGFRAPNLSDLTRFDSARSGELETPAPGLRPEHYVSYEAGVKTMSERFSGWVALFHTSIDGMIVRYPTGVVIGGLNEVTKANGGDGYVQGIEASGEWKLVSGWSVWGDITWMEGRLNAPIAPGVSAETALSRVQPLTGHFGVRWRDRKDCWWFETGVTLVDRADKLAPSDALDTQRISPGGTPGYGVWHMRGGWRVNEHISVSAGIQNVLDKDYRVHGSGINEPGRNLLLVAQIRF